MKKRLLRMLLPLVVAGLVGAMLFAWALEKQYNRPGLDRGRPPIFRCQTPPNKVPDPAK